ncbi:MAG: hypothetical protein ACI35O_10840 [Bacillaceae bacterium]
MRVFTFQSNEAFKALKKEEDLLNHELFESKFEGIFKIDYRPHMIKQ